MGPGGGGWKKCQIRSDAKFLEVGRIRKTGSGSGKRCDGQVGRVVQWPVSESRAATTCKSSPQRDTRRSQARERAEGQGRYGDTPTDPDSNTGPTKSEKRRDGCSTKNLSVWSVRACHHLSRSSRQFISKLFNPSSKNEAESPANTGTSDTTTTTPCRTKKQKTIKLTNPPPPLLNMLLSPRAPRRRRPMGLRMWTVMRLHIFLPCLPKTSPAAQFVASFASHRDPSRAVVAVRLPLSMQSSFKVSAVVGRVGSGLSAGASIRVVVLWDWLAALVVES